jgi:ATP-dependent RNA helicase DDX1
MKGDYVLQAIAQQKMDQAIVFCRTKVDCDNMEAWLRMHGSHALLHTHTLSKMCRSLVRLSARRPAAAGA